MPIPRAPAPKMYSNQSVVKFNSIWSHSTPPPQWGPLEAHIVNHSTTGVRLRAQRLARRRWMWRRLFFYFFIFEKKSVFISRGPNFVVTRRDMLVRISVFVFFQIYDFYKKPNIIFQKEKIVGFFNKINNWIITLFSFLLHKFQTIWQLFY